jgi:hypothetical protein
MNHSIASVAVVRYPVVRVTFDDGFAGDYDMSDLVAKGRMFAPLRDEDVFGRVAVGEDGSTFGWNLDDTGNEIDFCPDATRVLLETEAVRRLAEAYEREMEARAPLTTA